MYVTLPIPLVYAGVAVGFGTFISYINTIFGLAKREQYFDEQVCIQDVLYS